MEIKTGLWNKTSEKGTTYASGKIKIDEKEYNLTLFINQNKKSDKSPDYNIILRDSTNTPKKQENASNEPKNNVYADFGQQIQTDAQNVTIDDEDLPF